jgi:hypothetical protein
MTPEDAVRAYFDTYSQGHPERFDESCRRITSITA